LTKIPTFGSLAVKLTSKVYTFTKKEGGGESRTYLTYPSGDLFTRHTIEEGREKVKE